MIELTPEQKRQIYEEEKARLESEGSNVLGLLFLTALVAGLFLTTLLKLTKSEIQPKIEDLRKAYPGIDTEEYK
jgi:hypothetical protein